LLFLLERFSFFSKSFVLLSPYGIQSALRFFEFDFYIVRIDAS
jgi:hypothetical protein